jgi:hypothetical protein
MTGEVSKRASDFIGDVLDKLVDMSSDSAGVSFKDMVEAAGLDPGRDFIGAFLQNLDFRGEDLRGFDFTMADLAGADFRRANVAGVSFSGADLTGTIGLPFARNTDSNVSWFKDATLIGSVARTTPSTSRMAAELINLVALDEDDLQVISAHLQDALMNVGDVHWRPSEKRVVIGLARFDWEDAERPGEFQRRSAALRFDRVTSFKCRNVDTGDKTAIYNLLAVSFEQLDNPSGVVTLTFSGGQRCVLKSNV